MNNQLKRTTPKFISLFVPNGQWFQDLLQAKTQELLAQTKVKLNKETGRPELDEETGKPIIEANGQSLSSFLLKLVVDDLLKKGLITRAQFNSYQDRRHLGLSRTLFGNGEKHLHETFSLYLPKPEEFQWLRDSLDPEFIKAKCRVKSRGLYIWNLFINSCKDELTAAQRAEWKLTMKPPTPKKELQRTARAS